MGVRSQRVQCPVNVCFRQRVHQSGPHAENRVKGTPDPNGSHVGDLELDVWIAGSRKIDHLGQRIDADTVAYAVRERVEISSRAAANVDDRTRRRVQESLEDPTAHTGRFIVWFRIDLFVQVRTLVQEIAHNRVFPWIGCDGGSGRVGGSNRPIAATIERDGGGIDADSFSSLTGTFLIFLGASGVGAFFFFKGDLLPITAMELFRLFRSLSLPAIL